MFHFILTTQSALGYKAPLTICLYYIMVTSHIATHIHGLTCISNMHIFVWEEAGRNPHRPNVKGELHTERPHCDVTLLTTGSLCCSQNESDVLCPQKSEELIISGLQLRWL